MPIDFVLSNSAFINIGSGGNLDNQYPFTISAWIYPRSNGAGQTGAILGKAGSSSSTGRWWLQFNSANRLIFDRTGTTELDYNTVNNAVSMNQWSHVACTYNGSTNAAGVSIYVNGVTAATGTTQNGATLGVDTMWPLFIGMSGPSNDNFDGLISEVAFWGSAVLSAGQIKALASSKVKGFPLQIKPATGALRFYYPMDDFSDGSSTPSGSSSSNAVRDRSGSNNNGSCSIKALGAQPTARAEQVLSYLP